MDASNRSECQGVCVYKYQFTSTVEDLLEAEEAERTARSARAPFRWILALLGAVWLSAGIIAFDWSSLSWRPIVWSLLGAGVLYCFVIRPYLRRGRIKRGDPRQDVALKFCDDFIKIEISGFGDFTRKWEDLVEFIDARKGVIFYFNDGAVNWLPGRVFSDKRERKKFVEFLRSHQNKDR